MVLAFAGEFDDDDIHSQLSSGGLRRVRLPPAVWARDMETPGPCVKWEPPVSDAAQAALSMSVFEKSSPV